MKQAERAAFYRHNGMTHKEIGERIGVSKQRISATLIEYDREQVRKERYAAHVKWKRLGELPIDDLPDVNIKVRKALKSMNVQTVADLKNLNYRKLERTPGCGAATIERTIRLQQRVNRL